MEQDTNKEVTIIARAPKAFEDSLRRFEAFFSDVYKFIRDLKHIPPSAKAISCEVALKEGYLNFQFTVSSIIKDTFKSFVYSHFPTVELNEIDSKIDISNKKFQVAEFFLKRSNFYPLKTTFSVQDDPYIALSAIIQKLNRSSDGIILQLILTPEKDVWRRKFFRHHFSHIIGTWHTLKLFVKEPFVPHPKIGTREDIITKYSKSYFRATLRVLIYSKDDASVNENFTLVAKTLSKFDNADINELVMHTPKNQAESLSRFQARSFFQKRIVLNTQEAAALFHFPDEELNVKNVLRISAKRAEPPRELPISNFLENKDISTIAETNFRDQYLSFGIKRNDRKRHVYIIGKTGMGKSKLIELLVISDVYQGAGFCLIDPHGDLAIDALRFIPKERMQDVIYFNPADAEFPMGFNPLQCSDPNYKHQIVAGFIHIFKKLFSFNWTNRLEHMLRFTILALLDYENSTVIDIVKLLSDTTFRQKVIAKIKDPVVKNFWTHEFAAWNQQFASEAITPLINHVGEFVSNHLVRNVIGQKESAFNIADVMNTGKILIINLAKGRLGDDNAALLGSMIINKIHEATMARSSIPEKERRDFYLYVDEFQSFATDTFTEILSEARKFNLAVTVAHQYIDQLTETIRKTIFGNVGSIIAFRVGSEDGHFLQKEFSPVFSPEDLVNINIRDVYLKLSVEGKTSEPFSAHTITVPEPTQDVSSEIIKYNQSQFCRTRNEVEKEIALWGGETLNLIGEVGETQKEEKKKLFVDFEEPLV